MDDRNGQGKELVKGKTLYEQSEAVFLGKEFPDDLVSNGYMLTYASPSGDIEIFITKEACDEHTHHYVIAITQKSFIPNHVQTPGTLVFLFNSWKDLRGALPIEIEKFRKLDLQLLLDAVEKQEQAEKVNLRKLEKVHSREIITPAQFRRERDKRRFYRG